MIEYFIAEWKLIPSSGGIFEITLNGELIFSKKALKRHAEAGEIRALLRAHIDAYKQEKGIHWDSVPDEE